MPHLMEITYEDIQHLTDLQLTDLLRRLLRLEATSGQIPLSAIEVPLKIDVADDGGDGQVQWEDGPEKTTWIPNRFTLFQCKATNMKAADCAAEVRKDKKTLKARVEKVFDSGGTYVLFYGRNCPTNLADRRIKKIRQAIKEVGKPYAETADIRIYDANRIAEWTNQYLATKVVVCKWIGRYLPIHITTWQTWKPEWSKDPVYITDDTINGHIKFLRSHLTEPGRILRIVGLSGLGKSRMAFETFRPPESAEIDSVQQTLSDQVVYINCNQIGHPQELPAIVTSWITNGLKGILIVDNCDLDLHQKLSRVVTRSDSNFSLLTLDYDLERLNDCPYIELKPTSDQVIKGILKQTYPELLEGDIDRIAQFAQGFPQMAVLLAKARLDGESTIGKLHDTILLNRLLWGREQRNERSHQVISTLSLFDHVGFEGKKSQEREFIARYICKMEPDEFYRLATRFIERGILDRRGDYVRVTPQPLAVRLAADWWLGTPTEFVAMLLEKLPPAMSKTLCDQVAKLHFLPKAQEFVANVCGPQAPFSRAEVLNSEQGSRLFRPLVEVNPQATAAALERVFGKMTRPELLTVGPGRRNLVWALEKLCFWAETFHVAARLLLAFAAAENESFANNATGQFLQLFHVYLSGTQAPPEERLFLIEDALASEEPERRILGIKALSEALKVSHFTRDMGAEIQGSRPVGKDWEPRTWGEAFNYWRAALRRLTRVACKDSSGESKLAREKIAESMRGMVRVGLLDELEMALSEVTTANGTFWPEALEQLLYALRYEGPGIPEQGLNWIKKWIDALQPTSIPDRLRLIVACPPFGDFEKGESGEHIDLAEIKAQSLAEELAVLDTSWFEHLPIIFQGEQRQGYPFGFRLARKITKPESFIDATLNVLRQLPPEIGNPMVLCGFLSGIKPTHPDLVQKVLDMVGNDDALIRYIVDLTRFAGPAEGDLERIIRLVQLTKVPVGQLNAFAYGSVLDALPMPVVTKFCDAMIALGVEGAAVALHVLYMYCWNDEEKQKACREESRKILMVNGLLSYPNVDEHAWEQQVLSLLESTDGDQELAIHVTQEVIDVCANAEIYRVDHALAPVLRVILSKYPEQVWYLFAEAFLAKNPRLHVQINHLLGAPSPDRQQPVILSIPLEILLQWCSKEHEAPVFLARIIPLFEVGEGREEAVSNEAISWTPLALSILDKFGTRPEVLSAINTNMATKSWSGSLVPYLRRDIQALEQLLNHELPTVRQWARGSITHIGQLVEQERRRDEEYELGIY